MNNLDHVKNFYPENYKMDLSETMKAALSKGPAPSSAQGSSLGHGMQPDVQQTGNMQGMGYVTEKLYMLLQLYLQNKGWNPSVELLQCFSELKDSAMLPSAAYLQVLASRLTLDSQGRLILRENGKIVLPFEHFANAVMLKHMSGPHGLHLSVEATVRAVVDSYTIGRENFGMEKDFIIEVVQSCPSPACRYYKSHMGVTQLPFMEQTYQNAPNEFLQHLPPPPPLGRDMDMGKDLNNQKGPMRLSKQQQQNVPQSQTVTHQQQQQITAAIIQQQNRAIAQQSLEKFGNLSPIEKQQVLQQLEKKHFEQQATTTSGGMQVQNLLSNAAQMANAAQGNQAQHLPPPSVSIPSSTADSFKSNDGLKTPTDSLESNKDLLALHNGAWGSAETRDGMVVGQEKIIRAFGELMRNMARMKTFIRPSMCKPYGKQSESLQKTLMDTIQLVQSLRNCLPAPHIPVSSWKSEDRHRKDPEITRVEN